MPACLEDTGAFELPAMSKHCSETDYPAPPATLVNKLVRVLYRVAYRAHLIANFFLRSKTRGAYVAVWVGGRILLIRNSYKPGCTLPSGGITRNELPVEAARRELHEEVGLDIPVHALQLVCEKTNNTEFKHDRIYLFEVNLKQPPVLQADGREVVWMGFRDIPDALNMPLFPPVREYLIEQTRNSLGDR